MTSPPGRVPSILAYAWLILLVRALLALGLGIVVLLTGELRPGIANVIAIYWLLGSLLTLRWARSHRSVPGERLAYAAGIAGLVASGAVIARDVLRGFLGPSLLLALLGLFCVVVGSLRVSGIFRESVSQEIRRSRREGIALGGLEIMLGIALIMSEQVRPIVVPMIGIWGLVGGTIMLADAVRARRMIVARRTPVARD